MEWQRAAALAKQVEKALAGRLLNAAVWEAAGLPRETTASVAVSVEATALEGADGSSGAAAGAVRAQVDIDAHTIACGDKRHWQERMEACLGTVVTACMDLIRCVLVSMS
jgi:hypothetical protein